MNSGRVGGSTARHGVPLWGRGSPPSSFPRICLVGGRGPKSHGESEARDALWEIKGRSKAASQLANCKASRLVLLSVARNLELCQEGGEWGPGGGGRAAPHLGRLPHPMELESCRLPGRGVALGKGPVGTSQFCGLEAAGVQRGGQGGVGRDGVSARW